MIIITEEAKKHLIRLLDGYNRIAVRLGLEEQGCNGYKYTWTPVTNNIADNVIELDENYSLIFDKMTALHIVGSIIDIVVEGLNKRLVINNPNVADSCGCGESVNFK